MARLTINSIHGCMPHLTFFVGVISVGMDVGRLNALLFKGYRLRAVY